jgi:hypothetical protein
VLIAQTLPNVERHRFGSRILELRISKKRSQEGGQAKSNLIFSAQSNAAPPPLQASTIRKETCSLVQFLSIELCKAWSGAAAAI